MIREEKMSKKELVIRLIILILTFLAITVCCLLSIHYDVGTPWISMLGGFVATLAIFILTYKLPFTFYCYTTVFAVFSLGFGTILNLYRTVGPYDKIIHFLSGVLLAEAGAMIIKHLFEKKNIPHIPYLVTLFAVLFSCTCAGLWEIYEFTGDKLLDMNMQGNNDNTMGDVVAGFLGGILYGSIYFAVTRSKNKKQI